MVTAAANRNGIVVATEWEAFRALDLDRLKLELKPDIRHRVLVDLRIADLRTCTAGRANVVRAQSVDLPRNVKWTTIQTLLPRDGLCRLADAAFVNSAFDALQF
jgi:hypothetical protein